MSGDNLDFVTRLSFAPPFPSAGSKQSRHEARSVPRGTDGSNPLPSSKESANHRFLSGAAAARGARAAATGSR
jgi:hypothetical protein